jgi:hypothetical protein
MALPSPNLDDRTFAQLVEDARRRIQVACPEWSDLTVSDPGMVLLEAFAYLTDGMIYRLNRVSEKAYIAFLQLLGVSLLPPEAASTKLVFRLPHPAVKAIEIPRGTRVSVSRAESGTTPPIFVVPQPAVIPAGKSELEVLAYHCDLVDGELLGRGTGAAGLSVSVSRPPIISALGDSLDLVVAVEVTRAELDERVPAREFGGKVFRVWREVENFTELGPDPYVYMADRTAGLITFAPAARMRDETGSLGEMPNALAAVPPAGREIRAWYQCGGGPQGNVAANTLTVLKDAIPGIAVTNPAAAVGGRSAETLDNALVRGPQELHSLQRAVTARDFELAARRFGAICRARAITKAALWTYAMPGTVEVILVPSVEEQKRAGRVSAAQIQALQTEEARTKIQNALDERRPCGTELGVCWANYKEARVRARIVAHAEEDLVALKQRVLDRLYETINPLPCKTHSGWRFGQALRISNVYDAALAEPGVNYVDEAQLIVEDVPDSQVACLAVDAFQPQTWYAGSQSTLYRSLDDAEGWAAVGKFEKQLVYSVQSHPAVPGLIAVATRDSGGAAGSKLYVSWDCGENWQQRAVTAFNVEDMAWAFRDGVPLLFLATSVGLFELPMQGDAGYVQVFVRPDDQQIGYYAVAATNQKEGFAVAVASQKKGGVFLSSDGGRGNTFRNIGMAGEDVRVLAVQYDGPRAILWAGLAAQSAGDPGKGCFAWDPMGPDDPPNGWQAFGRDWLGGSCVELAFQGSKILAGTYDAGVLWLEKRSDQESWHAPDINCGLPQVSREHPLERVDALAADLRRDVLMTGGKSGVFRSRDSGQHYESCSRKVFADKVALDPNWLFCSGEHEIEVVTEGEKRSD